MPPRLAWLPHQSFTAVTAVPVLMPMCPPGQTCLIREGVLQVACRSSVSEGSRYLCQSIHDPCRYSKEWEKTVRRIGRWIDFENDYKTLDPTYMESVWWVFKQLWEKGLVYRGFKVSLHQCTWL